MYGTVWYYLFDEKCGYKSGEIHEKERELNSIQWRNWKDQQRSENSVLKQLRGIVFDVDRTNAILVEQSLMLHTDDPSFISPHGLDHELVDNVTARLFFVLPDEVVRKVGAYKVDTEHGKASAFIEWENKDGGRYVFSGKGDTLKALSQLFFTILEGTIAPHSDWSGTQVIA